MDGVNVGQCVSVIFGVIDGTIVDVGSLVLVTVPVGRGVEVLLGPGVFVGVMDEVSVWLGLGVGGTPETIKRPDRFQSNPTYIWTSYSPASHCPSSGWHSV